MRKFDIYKITYLNGNIKLYKQLKDFYQDYKLNTNDDRTYDNFRYIINNNLYKNCNEYKHRGKEHNYKLIIDNIEKFNFKEYLQEYLEEYKVVRQVKESEYTKSTQFYNKLYNLAKYRIEIHT